MTSPRTKDYVRTIYSILERRGRSARVTDIARRLGVAPATVTEKVQKLVEAGFVDHRKWRGVRLTSVGEEAARSFLSKHRLLEVFFAGKLGMDREEAHKEARRLEHGLSDRGMSRLSAFLEHPQLCPCGERIYINLKGSVDSQLLEPWKGP